MCGVNMVTGANSRNSRGRNRYYHCGTYHRKGSKACNRNGVSKEKIEVATLNSLIREFSLLTFPGSLEDEIRRHVEYQNRETTFQLARIEDDMKHLQKRIEIAKKEKRSENDYVLKYIDEMEAEIEALEQKKKLLVTAKTEPTLSPILRQL